MNLIYRICFLLLFFVINVFGSQVPLPSHWRQTQGQGVVANIPDPKISATLFVQHTSTGAIVFQKYGNNQINYISNLNYVAKCSNFGNNTIDSLQCVPSRISTSDRNENLPLPHSEIAFLQDITSSLDPANNVNSGFFGRLLSKHSDYSVIIIIKNSHLAPCQVGNWGPGIYCHKYLQSFCDNVKALGRNCIVLVYYPSRDHNGYDYFRYK